MFRSKLILIATLMMPTFCWAIPYQYDVEDWGGSVLAGDYDDGTNIFSNIHGALVFDTIVITSGTIVGGGNAILEGYYQNSPTYPTHGDSWDDFIFETTSAAALSDTSFTLIGNSMGKNADGNWYGPWPFGPIVGVNGIDQSLIGSPVPLPAPLFLLGVPLLGMFSVIRRRDHASKTC